MSAEFPIVNVIMLVGAAQGGLIAALILQKHRTLYANRFLAMMMIAMAAILVHLTVEDIGGFASIRWVFPLLFAIPLAVPPLLYLYAEYLANRSNSFPGERWLHFLPSFLAAGVAAALVFGSSSHEEMFADQSNMDHFPAFFLVFNWAIILQGAIYIVLVLVTIRHYNERIKEYYASYEALQLRWLQNITSFLVFAWFIFFAENSLVTVGINFSHFIISSVLVALYLLVLGYMGLLKSGVLESSPQAVQEDGSLGPESIEAAATAKYERSGLSPEVAQRYKMDLLELMERERLFVRSDLTLPQLADRLSVSPHNLSEVINTQIGKNFYEFVNAYRVEQVKRDLHDPAKQNLKMLSIAYDAGFNSKASFNTVFKQFTSLTPSEYRKRASQSASD